VTSRAPWIVWLSQSAPSPTAAALLGGKAQGLLRLRAAGFDVPDCFCVTAAASQWALTSMLRAASTLGAGVEAYLTAQPIPAALCVEVSRAYRALIAGTRDSGDSPIEVAVRSSALDEDGAAGSYAGQYVTVLGVRSEAAVFAAIKQVWLGLFAPRTHLYRHRAPLTEAPPLPSVAVIIQRMIQPSAAGVMFTDEPLGAGAWGGRVIVNATPGLGEAVVQGLAATTYYLPRRHNLSPPADAASSTASSTADHDVGLSAAQRAALSEVAHRVEAAFASASAPANARTPGLEPRSGDKPPPQDIEFAFEQGTGRLWLLQARPIVVRGEGEGAQVTVYTNANVGEALPGVGTPMTWSLVRGFARHGFASAFGALGLTVPPEYALFAEYRGRVYLNLTEFVSVASQIPLLTPQVLARLSGVDEAHAAKAQAGGAQLGVWGFLRRLPWTAPRALVSQAAMPWVGWRWAKRLGRAREDFRGRALGQRDGEGLGDDLRWLDGLFRKTGALMLGCSANMMASYVVAGMALTWALGEAQGQAQRMALMSDLQGVESAAPGLALRALARWVDAQPAALRAALEAVNLEGDWQQALRGVDGGEALLARFAALLDRWGHRAAREADLITPRWSEDPRFLLMVLRQLLAKGVHAHPVGASADVDICADVRADDVARPAPVDRMDELSGRGLKGRIAAVVLRWCRGYARLREALRSEVVSTLGMYRRLMLEVGRRMVARADIVTVDDVFFLTLEEARQWLEGAQTPLRLVIALRRSEHAALSAASAPPGEVVFDWMRGRAVSEDALRASCEGADKLRAVQTQAVQQAAQAAHWARRGLSGSAGAAIGRVRVLIDAEQGAQLLPGEVLVVPFADVGWTPLFLIAAAVVTERGGPLSHACVVAREYGVPMVVNVADATQHLRTGDEVSVNGDAGVVTLLTPRPRPSEGAAEA
jgi:phosphohistidine swiveling domain-containing protein